MLTSDDWDKAERRPVRGQVYLVRQLLPIVLAVVLACSGGAGRAADTLVMVDASVRTGAVARCTPDMCVFSGTEIPRATITYIGLGAAMPPPTPRDGRRDEVHRIDASIHPGSLLSLDGDTVVAGGISHPRKSVAWIYLAPRDPSTSDRRTSGAAGATYVWSGTIRVDNTYNGENGYHRWRGEYQIRFLEDHASERETGVVWREGAPVSTSSSIIPQELRYTIDADQHYDRGAFELRTRADGTIYRGDLRMLGQASGAFNAEHLATRQVLLGAVNSLEVPTESAHDPARRFTSHDAFVEFQSQQITLNPQPGGYHLSIAFPSDEDGSWQRVRALYDGIDRTGRDPADHPDDPALDFVSAIHAIGYMPDGTLVVGRLDSPDQADVKGSLSFPADHRMDRHITIQWDFQRTRR